MAKKNSPQTILDSGFSDWVLDRLPDLSGKTYVITGANGGLGLVCVRELGRRGANIIMACRSMPKAEAAKKELETTVRGYLELVQVDLSDMASVRHAANKVRKLTQQIDGLINNAGVMQTPETRTVDGFELQFAANHLGHFLWTGLLIDLVEAASGRVVPVSSIAHKSGRIDFQDLMQEKKYSPTQAYAQSKLANLMFGLELDRRLQASGSSATAIIAHPGVSATDLQFTGPVGVFKFIYWILMPFISQSPEEGAVPLMLAAAGKEAKRCGYYGPTGSGDMKGPISDAQVIREALDRDAQRRLWEASEKLTKHEWVFSTDLTDLK